MRASLIAAGPEQHPGHESPAPDGLRVPGSQAQMRLGQSGFQKQRALQRRPHPSGVIALDPQRAHRLRVAPHRVGVLKVRRRIFRILANRFLSQLHGAAEQIGLRFFRRQVMPVNRQRFGRQRIPVGSVQGFGDFRGLNEPALAQRGARRFDRLAARGPCGEQADTNRHAGQPPGSTEPGQIPQQHMPAEIASSCSSSSTGSGGRTTCTVRMSL